MNQRLRFNALSTVKAGALMVFERKCQKISLCASLKKPIKYSRCVWDESEAGGKRENLSLLCILVL